jgi:putative ABC transport system permease protein
MENLLQDIRYALRILVKRPGFAFTIVLTLALGIGANTAIFSFVNAILLRPLPFKEPDRLVRIAVMRGSEEGRISMIELQDLKREVTLFEDVAAYIPGTQYNYDGGGAPEELAVTHCTSNLFNVLGIPLLHGNVWPEAADLGVAYEVVLTHELWKRRFGGSTDALNQKISLDAAPYTIHGVLPPQIQFPNNVQLFRSITVSQNIPNYTRRAARNVYALARLKPGVNVKQAQSEVEAFGRRLAQQYPDINEGLSFTAKPLADFYVGDARPYLLLLFIVVGLVLLIACGNVVNLLLTQALTRDREVAVRTALGAGRGRLIRQLLTESALLALTGGVFGLLLSALCVRLLSASIGVELPPWIEIKIDERALIFTLTVSILTGILAGIAPALNASKPDLNELLKEGARGSSDSRHRLRRALVVAEIALALVLLVGAGLMVRSLIHLQRVDLGFNSDNLLTLRVTLSRHKYKIQTDPRLAIQFYQQTLEKLRALPGVEAVAATTNLPLTGETQLGLISFTVEGQSASEQQRNPFVNNIAISPDYFDAMGIRLLRGRAPNDFDLPTTDLVYVISERLADLMFPGQDPIGRRIKQGVARSPWKWGTVVGVVKDVKHDAVTGHGSYDLYSSFQQQPNMNLYLLLRANVDPMSLGEAATRVVWSVDPDQSTFDIATMEQRVADTIWQRRLSRTLFVIFAALALALTAIGIYGVMSYTVRQRTREIGVRLAMGAQGRAVIKMILIEALQMILIGGAIGLGVAFGLSRLIKSLLFGVSAIDPLTFAGVSLLLVLVALVAGYLPARRAAKVDPVIALRSE